jgi:hypothetical protein
MRLILLGAGITLGGLVLLLAMVIRLIEPGLALSLAGYATAFVGMFIGLAGAVRLSGRRR